MKKIYFLPLLLFLFMTIAGRAQDCEPITVSEEQSWFNDFESVPGSNAVAFDDCWATPVLSSFNSPFYYCGYAPACHSGSNSVEIKGNTGEMCMLVLPEFSNDLNTLRFYFYGNTTASSVANAGNMELGYITDVEDTSTFVKIWTITPPSNCLSRANSVLFGYYDFVNIDETVGRIAFRWTSSSNSTSWNLDDFTVTVAPPCPEPSGVAFSNVTSTSAEISWFENTDESYDIVYITGTDTSYVSGASQTDGSYLLDGLNPSTLYTVYVRMYCSEDGSYVNSINSVSFNTPGEPIELPYERTFEEDASEITEFTYSGSGVNQWVIGSATGVGDSEEEVHSLYISNDGGENNAYTLNNTSSSYAVIDMEFPDENTEWHLSFDYKVNGQAAVYSWASYYYDYLSVYLMDASAEVPTSGTPSGTALLYQAYNVTDWTHVDYTLENVAGTAKKLVFYWVNNSSSGNQPPAAIDNIAIIGSSCIQPNNFAASNIEMNEATITWTENGSATDWTVYYRLKGSSDEFESVGASGDAEATIYGLNPDTDYEYYVVSECGDESSVNTEVSYFHTACGPISVSENEWTADFEGGDEQLSCWVMAATGFYNNKTFPNVVSSSSVSHNSSKALEVAFGNIVAALPEFEEELSTLQISFWAKRNSYSSAYANNTILEFGYITDLSDTTTFVALDTMNFTTYTKTERMFASVAGLGLPEGTRMAFRFHQINSANLTSWYIDDVTVSLIPDCAAPTANSVSISNLTESSAAVSFVDDDESHDTWEIYYKPVDSEDDYTVMEVSNQNGNLIEGLESNTTYTVYVKTVCSGIPGDNQTDAVTFTTTTIPTSLPMQVDFEDTDENSQWVLVNGTQNNKWYIGVPTDEESDVNTTEEGEYGLYISNDNGASNKYSSSSVVYAYRDILVPDGTTNLILSFDWKAYGGSQKNEFLRVYWLDPSIVNLTAGNNPPTVDGVNYDAAGQPGNYGSAATEHWLSRETTWQHQEMLISSDQFAGMGDGDKVYRLAFQWRSTYYSSNPPAAVDNITLKETSCNVPTNLAVSNVEETSATISWEGDSPEYLVAVISADTVYEETSGNELELTGLNNNTKYTITVRGLCDGDTSMSSMPLEFMTACGVMSLEGNPWTADFEGSDEEFLSCWVSASTGERNGHTYPHIEPSSFIAHAGTAALEVAFGNIVTALPLFAEPLEEIQISFWAKSNRWSGEYPIILGYITDPYDSTTFVGLDTLEFNTYTQINKSFATLAGMDLPSTTRIAFKYDQGSSTNLTSWYLDDVVVSLIPDCAAPQHNSVTVTNVTNNSAVVSFIDEDESHESWMIYYRPTESEEDYQTLTVYSETDNTLANLESNTSYTLYVKTICSGVEGDDQTESVEFLTTTLPATMPFSVDFESEDENEQWVLINGTQTNQWYIGTPEDVESDVNTTEAGTKGLYISNDQGITNSYSSTTSRVYAYRDILIPDGTTELKLSFDWKAMGGSAKNEFMRVYWFDPSVVTLTAGNNPPTVDGVNYDAAGQPGNYGSAGSEHWLSQQNTWQHQEMLISSEQFEGMGDGDKVYRLVFHWRNTYYSSNPPAAVDNIKLEEVTCSTPIDLEVSNIEENSANISWSGEADSYEVILTANGTSTTYTTEDTSLSLEDLLSSTTYEVAVRAFCGTDSSMLSQTVIFKTSCGAITILPYSNDFETYSMMDGSNYIDCWSRLTSNSSHYVYANAQFNHTAGGNAALDFHFTPSCYTMAIMPKIGENISIQDLQAEFYARKNSINGTFDVGVMTDPSDATTFVVVESINFANTNEWELHTVLFSQYTGEGRYIAFRSNDAAMTSYVMDDLVVDYSSTPVECTTPTALAVNGITETAATATWTAGGEETAWKLQYKTAAATSWGSEIAVNTTPSYQMTGLTAGTAYQVRVKAVCDEENESDWTEAVAFTTNEEVVEPCNTPTNVAASNITKESMTITWNANGANQWNLQYRVVNGTWSTVAVEGNPTYTITDLTEATEYQIQVQAVCDGTTSAWSTMISQSTGINARLMGSISLYPNPASNYVDVRVSDNDIAVSRLEVYDVYGKLINEVEVIENPTRINVENLASGMYFVKVITNDGVATKNFIKK